MCIRIRCRFLVHANIKIAHANIYNLWKWTEHFVYIYPEHVSLFISRRTRS